MCIPLNNEDKFKFQELKHRLLSLCKNKNHSSEELKKRSLERIKKSNNIHELIDSQGIIYREETLREMINLVVEESYKI